MGKLELALPLRAGIKVRAKSRSVTPEESQGVTVISEHPSLQRSINTSYTLAWEQRFTQINATLTGGGFMEDIVRVTGANTTCTPLRS